MQKLIMPINNSTLNAGYKHPKYYNTYGWNHYGWDLSNVTGTMVFALGNGTVAAAGLDGLNGEYSNAGNVVVIVYPDVYVHSTGKVMDLACRCYHFSKVLVKAGDKVTKDTQIGIIGNTGGVTLNGKRMGVHLHIEFDTDAKNPCYAPGIKKPGGAIIKAGVDSTINPADVLHVKSSAPDKQSFKGNGSGWYTSDELTLPDFDIVDAPVQAPKPKEATGVSWYEEHYKSLAPQYNSLLARYNTLVKKYNALVTGDSPTEEKIISSTLNKATGYYETVTDSGRVIQGGAPSKVGGSVIVINRN